MKNKSVKMSDEILFVQNGYVALPETNSAIVADPRQMQLQPFGTIVSNMAFYGYIPSLATTEKLMALNEEGLAQFWKKLKPALAYLSGEDRNMGKYIVYKNFPKEVLEMSEARYWTNQILMYWGMPPRYFTESVKPRAPITDKLKLKVLDLADESTSIKLFNKLCRVAASWTDFQDAQVNHLVQSFSQFSINMDEFAQKENGAKLAASFWPEILEGRRGVSFSNATDVLRFAAAISGGDASLREKCIYKKLSRPERRFLVAAVENTKNIEADFAARPEQWKRLLSKLHPGEFKNAPRLQKAYDSLYNRSARTISSKIERGFKNQDTAVLDQLRAQPGQFLRRLHHAYSLFGNDAFEAFKTVTGRLTITQLARLDSYLKTVNSRKHQTITPKGSWSNLKVFPNSKVKIAPNDLSALREHISIEIGSRLDAMYPDGFKVASAVADVKLQTNGQSLAPYGRGTVFSIPTEADFIRMGSFWKLGGLGNVWFDVGCNFFDADWKPKSSLCWNSTHPFRNQAAVFSGDPVSGLSEGGKAGQLIDIYPAKLLENGVRYVVLNILSYNGIKFDDAEDIVATIQWGENAQKGELFEPSRSQAVFPITGKSLTKYICFMDIVDRKLVYMDVDLRGTVSSACANEGRISEMMPAFVEYLDALPSINDVFSHGQSGSIPVLYTDEGVEIEGPAYVFDRKNAENKIVPLDVATLLLSKGDVVTDDYISKFGMQPGV